MFTIQRSQLAVLSLAFVVLFGSVGGVAAQSENPEWGQELFTQVESMVDDYNANVDSIDLGPINLAGATNIYVNDGSEQATYTVYMDSDNRIVDVKQGTDEDAKRKITTDRATLQRIASADDPAAEFRTAVENDDIVISGEDDEFVEQLKWAVINFLKGFLL